MKKNESNLFSIMHTLHVGLEGLCTNGQLLVSEKLCDFYCGILVVTHQLCTGLALNSTGPLQNFIKLFTFLSSVVLNCQTRSGDPTLPPFPYVNETDSKSNLSMGFFQGRSAKLTSYHIRPKARRKYQVNFKKITTEVKFGHLFFYVLIYFHSCNQSLLKEI